MLTKPIRVVSVNVRCSVFDFMFLQPLGFEDCRGFHHGIILAARPSRTELRTELSICLDLLGSSA
jgi:hypothetical protein